MRTDDFDFHLPPERIAQHPVEPRDQSRLMVVRPTLGRWDHHRFLDLPELLAPGDLLVRNDTRVVPARLTGRRVATGGRWEGLYLAAAPDGSWQMLTRTRGRPASGEEVESDTGLRLRLEANLGEGRWSVRPLSAGVPFTLLQEHGTVPLPPYIRKGEEGPGDRDRYQTVYARAAGSVAAPTAGLHFTPRVFEALAHRSIHWADLTLHVGIGTFRPIEAETIESHVLHAETAELSKATAEAVAQARASGGRVVAVGTTSARTLETAARLGDGRVAPFRAETALYIRPGHRFLGLDALLTNFHLPRSSLLVLVAALAGRELILEAYQEAVREEYRFYSYGDAMLILP